jgi:SAM-dependent methyltransferase
MIDVSDAGYHLGSGDAELRRLDHQGQVLAPATRMLFQAAGIGAGMRVLDLGSGAGDVAFLVAELVGPSGEIVGVDQSADAVARATARARDRGATNVRFVVGDIMAPAADGAFDAIVCRLVLMYLRDPAAALRAQARQLRRGGIVAPIEFEIAAGRSLPATPLAGRAAAWISEAFKRSGADIALGPRLWSVLGDAGLRPLGMLSVQPHFGPDNADGALLLAGIVRAVLPLIERTGVATADEVAIDTLLPRIRDEFAAHAAVFAFPALFSAWGTRD